MSAPEVSKAGVYGWPEPKRITGHAPADKALPLAVLAIILLAAWLRLIPPRRHTISAAAQFVDLVRLGCTILLSLFIYYGPGLLVRHWGRCRYQREIPSVALPVPGLLFMAAVGLLIWVLSPILRPRVSAPWILVPLALGLVWFLWRVPVSTLTSKIERRALAVVAIVIAVGVAKATYSLGPVGELYGGSISRTLEVGDRSDSRISYHVVQVIAQGASPTSQVSTALFFPWNFSYRGPLAGMAAAPVVLAARATPPRGRPDGPWQPLDREGFATYRVAMIVMGASAFFVFWGLLSSILPPQWSYFGLLCAATTPFLVHETYFTWPKLQAAIFMLLAVFLILRSRWFVAGLALGLGYLFHPIVLLSAPAVAGMLLMLHLEKNAWLQRQRWALVCKTGVRLVTGAAIWVVLWRLANWKDFNQFNFLRYFEMAGSKPLTFNNWCAARFESLLNTLVPLHLFLTAGQSASINSVTGPSPPIIHFFFQYWNTLPFGLGILAFPVLIFAVLYFAYRHVYQFIFLVVLPFLLFWVYWGAYTTGLLREGLHVWVFTLVYVIVVALRESVANRWRVLRLAGALLASRGLEIIFMLLLPAMITSHSAISKRYAGSDAAMLTLMITGTALLCFQLGRSLTALPTNSENEIHAEARLEDIVLPSGRRQRTDG
jgi:hypothetical protein